MGCGASTGSFVQAARYSSSIAAAEGEQFGNHASLFTSARRRMCSLAGAASLGSVTAHYTIGKTLGAQPAGSKCGAPRSPAVTCCASALLFEALHADLARLHS